MGYYIEPVEQAEEVQKQLAEITPESLNPEELTLLDPACGSGHILAEAYDLLKEIYLERGYRRRDIPELILKKNVFGLEIDDRAAQLAGFAVMMKARADDRRLFEKGIVPNIVGIQESKGLDIEEIVTAINEPLTSKNVSAPLKSMDELQDSIEVPLFVSGKPTKIPALDSEEKLTVDDLRVLLSLFEHGKTFGSLIRIPKILAEKIPAMARRIGKAYSSGRPYAQAQAKKVKPFIQQALIMAGKYDVVVANPPYMGSKVMNSKLRNYAKDQHPHTKADVFAMFVERLMGSAKSSAQFGFVMPYVWMFISSYEQFRENLQLECTITSLVQLEYNAFEPACVPVAAFTLSHERLMDYNGVFIKLSDFKGHQNQAPKTLEAIRNPDCGWRYVSCPRDFERIPGLPIAYWVSQRLRSNFSERDGLGKFYDFRIGMATGKNDLYVRYWHEVSYGNISFDLKTRDDAKRSGRRWFPYTKGGVFRKWAGNEECVIDWKEDGERLRTTRCPHSDRIWAHNFNLDNIFSPAICWTVVTSSQNSFRIHGDGFLFDAAAGLCQSISEHSLMPALGLLNSSVSPVVLSLMNPTLNMHPGYLSSIPFVDIEDCSTIESAIEISREDWDSCENSWGFARLPLIGEYVASLDGSYALYLRRCYDMTVNMKDLEEENNRFFIREYGLEDELAPVVNEDQITLFANPQYRYSHTLSTNELEKRFREDTINELLSYEVGCMMGRYSLDEPGLIYAHSGNEKFDPTRYKTYKADDDGIIPITDRYWFDDDAAERFFKFVETAWPKETLEENLDFVAESIRRKSNETSREAIRRFFVNDFFKDHLKRYKKRPIYWLFSSGKEKALQCLVYLHRYNEGTLSRMRTEYLIPLQGRIASKIESLKKDMEHISSTSAANKIRKEITKLEKQAEELRKYDEKLRHYADMKIKLDLDDGVKVNYGKFGDLLAEVKAVTGKK